MKRYFHRCKLSNSLEATIIKSSAKLETMLWGSRKMTLRNLINPESLVPNPTIWTMAKSSWSRKSALAMTITRLSAACQVWLWTKSQRKSDLNPANRAVINCSHYKKLPSKLSTPTTGLKLILKKETKLCLSKESSVFMISIQMLKINFSEFNS